MTTNSADYEAIHAPAWSAINQRQSSLGSIRGSAATYDDDVSLLGGLRQFTPQALSELESIVPPGTIVGIMGPDQDLPLGDRWRQLALIKIHQMICEEPQSFRPQTFLELGRDDVEEMLGLVELTDPGPFAQRTIEMGTYLGIRDDAGKLVAMAGERFKPDGWTEISGVCTRESARGKGYAASLVGELTRRVHERGEHSFLHVVKGSPSEQVALRVYERAGFHTLRGMAVSILRNETQK